MRAGKNPNSKWKIVTNGIVRNNPTFRLVLGTCPTLALTTAAMNGIYMGLATTFVLVCSNVMISLLRNIIPDKVRIPAYVLIIATFVTVLDMAMEYALPDVYEILGLAEPLRLADPNKTTGGVPLSKGHIWIMDVLQHKDGLVISAKFGGIEVPRGGVRIHFCHSPTVFQGNGVAHLTERFLIQKRQRCCVYAPKSCNSSWKYHFIVLYSQLCS